MLKRLFLLVLALALPSLLGVPASSIEAATGSTIAPPTAPEFEGLPDLQSATLSPRFLSVSGSNNFTIPGDSSGVAKNLIRLTFAPPAVGGRIKIAVYDGNASGKWDQRTDGVFVAQPPETTFEVFADPSDGAVLPPDLSTPLATLKASQILTDEVWTELWDVAASDVNAQKGLGADGRYHFLVRTTLLPASGSTLSGYEINGYKLAYNGTYVLPKGNVLGFTGGAIDGLVVLLPGSAQFLTTNDPYPNAYDGTFAFAFDPSNFCEDFEAYNGDADWNRALAQGETVDATPTGVPPDNGIPYINPQPPAGLRDASLFRLGAAVQYQFVKPDTTVFFDSAAGPQTGGRPSIDQSQEGLAPNPVTGFAPFQRVVLDKAALKAAPGRWSFRWTGLDAHNSVFIKFNQDFGTTPKIPVASGRIWCDDGDLTYEQGEFVFANTAVRVTPAGGPPGSAVVAVTNADGTWSLKLAAGLYDIELVEPPCAAARVNLPGRFVVDGCTGGRFDIPLNCALTASGHVFCDAAPGDKVFGAGDTPLAANVTIRLEKQGSAEFVEVLSSGTAWSASGLSFGTWSASVKAGQFTDALTKTSTQPQLFTLDAKTCSKSGIDFGYVCRAQLCVNLFCDYDNDCEITQGDLPLSGIAVTATLFPGGQPIAFPPTDATGRACLEVAPGNYILSIDPNQPGLKGAQLKQGPIDFVTVGESGGSAFFCYECFGQICGTVYLNKPNCDEVYSPVTDQGLAGITVNLWKAPKTVNDAPDATIKTGADGGYCFTMLREGDYILRVADGQASLVSLTPTQPVQRNPLLGRGESIFKQDFGYCAKARIYGKVFKESCTNTCDGLIDGAIVPLPGVTVSLVGTLPVLPPVFTVTNATGDYAFANLEPGQYAVSIDGGAPIFVNLTPTTPTNVGVTLLAGDDVMVNFPWCECPRARVYGYVYKNPLGTCNEVFEPGDTPLPGVRVTLTGQVNGSPVALEAFTNGGGFYSFENLLPGTYTVAVDGLSPQLVSLTPRTPGVVGPFVLPAGGEKRVDFGYCEQRVCGKVFRNPPCECNTTYEEGDTLLEDIVVRIVLTSGPDAGRVDTTTTGRDGRYCFTGLPVGTYEISIPDQGLLAGLTLASDAVLTVTVGGGDVKDGYDFAYCMPGGETKICAKVFCEPKGTCDGIFDEGRDRWMPWVEVFVGLPDDNDGYLTSGFTDENGKVCFENLAPGRYVVYIGANQPFQAAYRPSTPDCLPVVLKDCEKVELYFGWCQECKPGPCCEGDLHEVLVGTAFWVGDCTDHFDLCATLWRGCGRRCDATEIDRVCLDWCHCFPGETGSANEALTIVDVKVRCGVAYVVLKISSHGAAFDDGVFGRGDYKLSVRLNGTTYSGCAKLRCESFRPGMLFTLGDCCPPIPACDDGWRWDGRSCWEAPWLRCGWHCDARFLVLDTWSHEREECRPVPVVLAHAGN